MAGRKRNEVVGAGGLAALADRLRRLRDDQGLTLRELALKSGYSHASLSAAESGRRRPSWDLLQAFVQSCGENPAAWRQLWEVAGESVVDPVGSPSVAGLPASQDVSDISASDARATGSDAPSGPPAKADEAAAERSAPADDDGTSALGRSGVPGNEPGPRRGRFGLRNRRGTVAAGLLGVAVVAVAVAASVLDHGQAGGHSRPQVGTVLTPPPPAPEPERRSGDLTLVPGEVADLDSPAADWGVVQAPGTAADDVWFSDTDDSLHGNRNADIAVLPPGSVGTFDECALEQDYGVTLNPAGIHPGQLVCNITSDNRVALLRITDVQYDYRGAPDQVTFQVVVWVKLHKT